MKRIRVLGLMSVAVLIGVLLLALVGLAVSEGARVNAAPVSVNNRAQLHLDPPVVEYPTAGEEIRVLSPWLNVRNVSHSVPASVDYYYDFQVATDNLFASVIVSGTVLEVPNNHGITYWQVPTGTSLLGAGNTYNWRARAKAADVVGSWSNVVSFTIVIGPGAVWSDDGETWHLPLDTANARLSGTFGEAFHANIHNGIDFGSQAPGGNICGGSVRAPRSGVLTRVDAAGHHTVELRHPNADPAAQRTRYLHMQPSPPLAFQLGTYINQGTRIGDMGNAPGGTTPCHLHMEAWNDNETQSFNPLALAGNPIAATFGWAPEAFGAPTLNQLYLRRDRRLDAKNTGINGTTYILARTIQRYPTPGGNRLAPYRVQFFVNDQLLCDNFNGQLQCGIQFDALTWPLLPNKGTEALYYAYDTENRCFPADSNNCGNFNPPGQPPNKDLYLMYFRWPTWQLAQNLFAGPQTVRVVSSDYYGNSGERTMVIGPWLTASDDSVTVPGAVNSSEPGATVNIHIQNYNQNIEGQNRDTYSLSVQSNGPVVGLIAA
ncbi:MAG: M23 family metallopeptidase, partial [Anaerolineae bacterium]